MTDNALLVTLVSFAALVLAYFTYGRFLARRVFQLDPNRPTPAHTKEDGVDYVPTKVPVLFGHHFASIAGLGPILGPAVAVIWGWLPAVLWVVIGCIVMGAVHDIGALTVSLRYRGRSIGDVCRDLIGWRARILFLIVIFFLMSLAMGAFVNVITDLFLRFNPDAIIPSFGLMLVAMCVGVAVYKLGLGLGPATVVGLMGFAALIFWGVEQPVTSYDWFVSAETRQALEAGRTAQGEEPAALAAPYGATAALLHLQETGQTEAAADLINAIGSRDVLGSAKASWIGMLLAYGFVASVLPVWLLLQPRDYINSFQLYFALTLLMLGMVLAGATGAEENHINPPPFRAVADAPPVIPMLFVIIACGAVSGFHSLVSSGTTVRQLNRETDALPIGYGAMLTEGALAILVIMACVAGYGDAAWHGSGAYVSWKGIAGGGNLAAQLNAFLIGGANFMRQIGVPQAYGQTFLAVTVVAFALTTLDSATRLLRFNVEEIFRSLKLDVLANRYLASAIAVAGIALFGLSREGKSLWVMFGTGNQVLAALTLMTVSLFLFKLGRPFLYTLLPTAVMLTMSIWALSINLRGFFAEEPRNWFLIVTGLAMFALAAWMVVEAALSFARGRTPLNFGDDDIDRHLSRREQHEAQVAASASHLG